MKKNAYKSAVDKIKFDEQLDSKIMDYIKENNIKGEDTMKNNIKNKKKSSVAVAACAVFLLSGATYASVMNFRDVSHSKYGLVAETNKEYKGVEKDFGTGEEVSNTKEQRGQMEKLNIGYEVISEENGDSNVRWKKKSILKDTSLSYKSDDKKTWEVDVYAPVGMTTKYSYDDYNTALEDSKMPNIMKNLLSKVKVNEEITVDEYYTEESTDITRKVVNGEFNYKFGKINVELSKELNNNGVYVITGIEEATNQRDYQTEEGITYKLSDNIDGKILKTTTLASKGNYNLIIQFENLSDSEIEMLLESIDLSALDA